MIMLNSSKMISYYYYAVSNYIKLIINSWKSKKKVVSIYLYVDEFIIHIIMLMNGIKKKKIICAFSKILIY